MRALWWAMPGPRRFLHDVLDNLRARRSVIAVFPGNSWRGFTDALESEDERHSEVRWVRHRVRIIDQDAQQSPARILHQSIAPMPDVAQIASESSILQDDRFNYALVLLELVDSSTWAAWFRFLQGYAQACQVHDPAVRPVFCAIVNGAASQSLPQTDATLEILRWGSGVSRLDAELFASQLLPDGQGPALVRSVQVAVIASLAGPDPLLAERLASCDLEELFAPETQLRDYATDIGWTLADSIESGLDCGSCDKLDGAAFEHSAAVALSGDLNEIRHRVWRGQVRELLPYLELHRRALVEAARAYLSKPPISDGYESLNDIHDLELGTIWYYLKRARAPRLLVEQAADLRRMRNALAHLEPLSVADLNRLARLPLR